MYPVTHLVVHTINRNASPVMPAPLRSPRRRRRADVASDDVAIRAAGPGDAPFCPTSRRSTARRSQPSGWPRLAADPAAGTVLVADVDGHALAALDVDRDSAVADPFEPTASLVELLRVRAGQLARTRAGARRLPHIGVPHLRTP